MKKLIICLLALLGITPSCQRHLYENLSVEDFSKLISQPDVVLLDVRTAEEFAESHIKDAQLIDVKQSDFLVKACQTLPKEKTIAVYCRSGRRSVDAAKQLTSEGFKVVNLLGGILAWQDEGKPVTAE